MVEFNQKLKPKIRKLKTLYGNFLYKNISIMKKFIIERKNEIENVNLKGGNN